MYTTTINQNGMILLNKDARRALGLKLGDRVTIDFDKKLARIAKPMTDEEFFAKLDSMKSEKTKQNLQKTANIPDDELFDVAMTKALKEEIAEGRL